MSLLHTFADIATMITAGIAAYAYGSYRRTLRRRQIDLEKILARKTAPNDDSLTLEQLAIALKATKAQVIEAASKSKNVESWSGQSGEEYRFKLVVGPSFTRAQHDWKPKTLLIGVAMLFLMRASGDTATEFIGALFFLVAILPRCIWTKR
jgi:hypothetical protein